MADVEVFSRIEVSREMEREGYYQPKVRDLMTDSVITLCEDDTVKALKDLLEWKAIRHVPVTRDGNKLVGLVTQRDFLTVAVSKLAHLDSGALDELYSGLQIKDIMGKKVTTISPDAPLAEAAAIMYGNKFGCLPVVEKGELIGIITEADFVKSFLQWNAQFKQSV